MALRTDTPVAPLSEITAAGTAAQEGGVQIAQAEAVAEVPQQPTETTIEVEGTILRLPEGTDIDSPRVNGANLEFVQPDGSVIVVPNGAIQGLTIFIGGVELPPIAVAALFEANGIEAAAGPETGNNKGSGADFSRPVGSIGEGIEFGDLLSDDPAAAIGGPGDRDEYLPNLAPIFGLPGIFTARLSEEGLAGANADIAGSADTTDQTTYTFTLDVIDPNGDPLTFTFGQPPLGMSSDGVAITWTGVGTSSLTGWAGSDRVIAASIDSATKVLTVSLLKTLDHPGAGEDELDMDLPISVSDGRGGTADAIIRVIVEDDMSVVGNAESGVVDEDGFPRLGGVIPNIGGGGDINAGTVARGSLDISWGADSSNSVANGGFGSTQIMGDRSVVFNPAIEAPTGLTSNNVQVVYALNGAGTLLTATAGAGGPVVFTVSLSDEGAGSYVFTLNGVLDHPDGTQEDNIDLGFDFVVRDSDGDAVSSSFQVSVNDDSPLAVGTILMRTVEEEDLPNGNEDRSGSGDLDIRVLGNLVNLTTDTTGGPLNILWGADKGNSAADGGYDGIQVKGDRSVSFTNIDDAAANVVVTDGSNAPLNLSQLTSNGEQVQFELLDNNTVLRAFTSEGTVFTVTLSDTGVGSYDFVLGGPLDHPAGGGENALRFTFSFTARDGDGDAGTNDFRVQVLDDVPVADGAAIQLVAAENDIANTRSWGSSPWVPGGADSETMLAWLGGGFASTVSGSVASVVSFGADGAANGGGFSFAANTIATLNALNLTSNGGPVVFTFIGNVVVGYVNGAFGGFQPVLDRPVMSLELDGNGSFTFRLYDQLDHLNDGNNDENSTLANNQPGIDFGAVIEATDGDNDAIPLTGKMLIEIKDDVPSASISVTGNSVVHDETAGFDAGETPQVANLFAGLGQAIGYARADLVDTIVVGGADENASVSVTLAIMEQDAPATSVVTTLSTATGGAITLTYGSNGTVIGTDAAGDIAFAIRIDGQGRVSIAQYKALSHPDDGNHNDLVDLDGYLNAVVTVTDRDGDVATDDVGIGAKILFRDDGPLANGAAIRLTAAENDILNVRSQGSSPGVTEAGEHSSTQIALLGGGFASTVAGSLLTTVSFGADGLGRFAFTSDAALHMTNLGLSSKGQQLTFVVEPLTGVLIGYVNGALSGFQPVLDRPVMSLELNEDGSFTFRLYDQLDHATGSGNTLANRLEAIDFGRIVEAFDGDGDSVRIDGKLVITIKDDTPSASISWTGNVVTHDENASVQAGETTQPSVANLFSSLGLTAIGYARADLVDTVVVGGADDNASVSLKLAIVGDGSTTLSTITGGAITLKLENGMVIGSDSNGIAFAIHLDGQGQVSIAQYKAISHPDGTPRGEAVDLRNLINAVLTVTDHDNDTRTDSIAIGEYIQFHDDAPTVAPNDIAQLDDDSLLAGGTPTATGTLEHDFGTDGGQVSWLSNGMTLGNNGLWSRYVSATELIITQVQGNQTVDVVKLTLNQATGAYVIEQLGPVRHPLRGSEDSIQFTVSYEVRDRDGDTAIGTITVKVDDDVPSVSANDIVQLDDDSLLAGGTPTATGTLEHDFGADGGQVSWLSNGMTLGNNGLWSRYVSASELIITQVQNGQTVDVVKLTLNQATGAYVIEQLRPVRHPLQGSEDSIQFTVSYEVRDGDNDTAIGTITVQVGDDVPSVSANDIIQLDDDSMLAGGVPTATGTLEHDFGADGGKVSWLSNGMDLGYNNLWYRHVSATELIITQLQGAQTVDVIKMTLNQSTGDYVIEQLRPVRHPLQGSEDSIQFTVSYEVRDADGDAVTGTVTVNVDDDVPTVTGSLLTPSIIEGSAPLVGELASLVSFGADGKLGYFVEMTDLSASLTSLTSGGQALHYSLNGNALDARAGGPAGALVFTFAVNQDTGQYTLSQFRGIDHTVSLGSIVSTNGAQFVASAVNDVSGIAFSGRLSASGDVIIQITNAGSNEVTWTVVAQEVGGGTPGPLYNLLTNITVPANSTLFVNIGQYNDTPPNLKLELDGPDSPGGSAVVNSGAGLGYAAGTQVALDALTLDLSSAVTVRDGDGDSLALSNQLLVTIADSAPQSTGAAVAEVSETGLLDAQTTFQSLGLDFGRDAAGASLNFATDANGNPLHPAGITSGNVALQYQLYTTAGGEKQLVAFKQGETIDQPVFIVALTSPANPTGIFTLFQPLDHLNGNNTSIALNFSIVATDGDGSSVTRIFTVNVADDIPTAMGESVSGDEDISIIGNLADNVSGGADGLAETAPYAVATGPANGTLVLNSETGAYTYTPNANFNGTDSFTFTVTDADGDVSQPATVTVNVTPVNDAPVTNTDNFTVAEDTPLAISFADLLGNDFDVDGDSIQLSTIQGAVNGTLSVVANSIVFTPDSNFNGAASFKYTITDGKGAFATGQVNITVTPVNDAPAIESVVAPSPVVEAADASQQDILPTVGQLVIVDRDPGDVLDITLGSPTIAWVGGTLDPATEATLLAALGTGKLSLPSSLVATGELQTINYTWDPAVANLDFLGVGHSLTISYTVVINDGEEWSSTETISFRINGTNDAPVANDDSFTTAEGTPLTITLAELVGNDTDVDGDSLSVSTIQQAVNGTFNVVGGNIVFTPNANFSGVASFRYTVTDSKGGLATGQVNINVTEVNDAPTISALSGSINEDGPSFQADLLEGADDADGDTLEVVEADQTITTSNGQVLAINTHYVVAGGTFALTSAGFALFNSLASGQDDTIIFNYKVSDGAIATPNSLTISVTGTNDSPFINVLGGDTSTFTEGGAPVQLDVGNNAIVGDPDNNPFSHVNAYLTASIHTNGRPSEDVLSIAEVGGITLSGNVISYNGVAFGTFYGGSNGANLVIDPYGTADNTSMQAAVRALRYHNTNDDNPSTAQRGISISLTDGPALRQVNVWVNVNGVNDPSVINGVDNVTVSEGQAGVLIDTFTVTDVDSGFSFRVLDGNSVDNRFEVVAANGTTFGQSGTYELRLKAGQSFHFGAENADGEPTITRTIEVNDGTTAVASPITITVAMLNYAPVLFPIEGGVFDFEAGMQTWQTLGGVTREAVNGGFAAVIDTNEADGSGPVIGDIESFLGLSQGALSGLDAAVEDSGGAQKLTLSLAAGQTITFDWLFTTEDSGGDAAGFNDVAFFSVSGTFGPAVVQLLSSIAALGGQTSSGWQTFTYTAPASGTYTFGVGVLNVGDFNENFGSALSIDNFVISSQMLESVSEDPGAPIGAVGTLVSDIVDFAGGGGLDNVTDANNPGAVTGIALTGTNANGTWWYSLNNGADWQLVGAVSDTQALLLGVNGARIYFQPSHDFNGTVQGAITYRAWDQTGVYIEGHKADTSVNGGNTPFSTATGTANVVVSAVNDAPTAIQLSANSVDENDAGAVIGTLSTSDVDVGDTHSYTVSDNRFEVVNGQLKLKDGVALDYEAASTVTVRVTSTDSANASVSQDFVIQVGDVPENTGPVANNDVIDPIPMGWAWNDGNGHIYKYVAGNFVWQGALSAADAMLGGDAYLATITTAGEQAFADGLIASGDRAHIGGSDAATEGRWLWVTGPEAGQMFWLGNTSGSVQAGAYANWLASNPNNYSGVGTVDENYLALNPEGFWIDINDSNSGLPTNFGYLAEAGGLSGQKYGAITEDAPFSFSQSWLLANDIGNGSVSIQSVSATSALGALVSFDSNTGMITYDARNAANIQAYTNGQVVEDTFTYTMQDGNGVTSTATVTLKVAGANEAPVVTGLTASTGGINFAVSDDDSGVFTLGAPGWQTYFGVGSFTTGVINLAVNAATVDGGTRFAPITVSDGSTNTQAAFLYIDRDTNGSAASHSTGDANAVHILYGFGGNDTLMGRNANDFIFGGKDADMMTGGLGADKFGFAAGDAVVGIGGTGNSGTISGFDRITDFSFAQGDKLELVGTPRIIDSQTVNGTNSSLTISGQTIKSHSISDGVISFDDADTFATALTPTTEAHVAAVMDYLQRNDLGDAGTTVSFSAGSHTYVYQQVGGTPNAANDILIRLDNFSLSGNSLSGILTNSVVVSGNVAPSLTLASTLGGLVDTFDNGYGGYAGPRNLFTTNWIESGDDGSANSGDVRISAFPSPTDTQLRFSGQSGNGASSLTRTVDLTGITKATLSFDYQRVNLDDGNDKLLVEVSLDGANWTRVATIGGPDNDGGVFQAITPIDLSPYVSSATQIRFTHVGDGPVNTSNVDIIYVDNVRIDYDAPYVANGQSVAITSDAVIADPDDSNMESASVVLTNAQAGDRVWIGNIEAVHGASGTTNGVGYAVTVNGGVLTIAFTGSAAASVYEGIIESIKFDSSSSAPSLVNRQFEITLNDGEASSATVPVTLAVVAGNQAPLVTSGLAFGEVFETGYAPPVDDLIRNGDFDFYNGDFYTMAEWATTGGATVAGGYQSGGSAALAGPASISQTLNIPVAGTYTLSFAFYGGGAPFNVTWAGNVLTPTITTLDNIWSKATYTFHASLGSGTLAISSSNGSYYNIDAIKMMSPGAVPGDQTTNGEITFTDQNLTDAHTVSVEPNSNIGTFNATLGSPANGGQTGVVQWTYSVNDTAINHLAVGQTLTQTYTVLINDGHGGVTPHQVTVNIRGANDAPTAVDDALSFTGYTSTMPGNAASTPIVNEANGSSNNDIAGAQLIDRGAMKVAPNMALDYPNMPSLTIRGAIAADLDGGKDFYRIELKAGETIVLDTGNITNGLDPWLYFYGPDQTLFANNDDRPGGGDSTNSYIEFTVDQDGVYYIEVNRYNGTGNYDLNVTIKDWQGGVQGPTVVISVDELLANDFDPDDGDSLTVISVTGNGVTLNNDKTISINPGVTSFTYTVRDGSGIERSATVSVEQIIDPVTQPTGPLTVNDTASAVGRYALANDGEALNALNLNVASLFSGGSGTVSYSQELVYNSSNAGWINYSGGKFTGNPGNGNAGLYVYKITATDSAGSVSTYAAFTALPDGSFNLTINSLSSSSGDVGSAPWITSYSASVADAITAEVDNTLEANAGGGSDVMIGSAGGNNFNGGSGNDAIYGLGGNDTLKGGTGNDFIDGGAGDDTIAGGTGADIMIGGNGSDTFVFASGDSSGAIVSGAISGFDIVADFNVTQGDKLSLNGAPVAASATNSGGSNGTDVTVGGVTISSHHIANGMIRFDPQGGFDGNTVIQVSSNAHVAAAVSYIRTNANSIFGNGIGTGNRVVAFEAEIDGVRHVYIYQRIGTSGSSAANDLFIDLVNPTGWTTLSALISSAAIDPILLDLDDNGYAFNTSVAFDIDGDGAKDQVAWNSSGDGILAFDHNGDGVINNGTEIFSEYFGGTRHNTGAAALATLDSNGDGVIDANDEAFASLSVWKDANANGLTDEGELTSLTDNGITSITVPTAPAQRDIDGQTVIGEGTFTRADGTTGSYVEVALDTQFGTVGKEITGTNGNDILVGDDGDDILWGGAGADVFVMKNDGSVDTIADYVFGDDDAIDLSDLLGGQEPAGLVQLVEGDQGAVLQVDSSGTGSNWEDVAILTGLNDDDDIRVLIDGVHHNI